jgi:trimeric autotransporter adhesin
MALGEGNTFIGRSAGANNTGNKNIFLGFDAGKNETGSEKLYIDNSDVSTPLLYGEFDKNKLTINDSLVAKNFQMTDGAVDGYLLKSNSAGKATWTSPSNFAIGPWNVSGDDIYKSNTGNVGIGTSAPTEKLEVVGNMKVNAGRISITNTGNSVFIGEDAGKNDNLGGHFNTFLGYKAAETNVIGNNNIAVGAGALYQGTSSTFNVAVGNEALRFNDSNSNTAIGYKAGYTTTGSNNTFVGKEAGYFNNGSGNIFIGYAAGILATGSNKLFIENTNTTTPLIYGEFDNNEVGINTSNPSSTFEVGGSFGMTFKNSQVAGTDQPDASAVIWRYNSGTGNINLPAASNCANRVYKILNQTGGVRTITSFINTNNIATTTIPDGGVLTLVSDGAGWFEIK